MKKFAKITAVALIAIMALAVLVACGPASSPDKAEKALKSNDYVVTNVKGSGYTGLTAVVTGTKVSLSDPQFIMIYYFESASAANDAWESIKSDAEKNSNKKNDSDWVVAKSGKLIYFGTKQAVKDAR